MLIDRIGERQHGLSTNLLFAVVPRLVLILEVGTAKVRDQRLDVWIILEKVNE